MDISSKLEFVILSRGNIVRVNKAKPAIMSFSKNFLAGTNAEIMFQKQIIFKDNKYFHY